MRAFRAFATRRPLRFTLFVMLLLEAVVLAGVALARFAGVPLLALDLPLLAVNALIAAALLSALGWWRAAGFTGPRAWKGLHLLAVPALLLLAPALALGLELPAGGQLVGLLVVALLIAFQEEAIFRGVLLRALEPRGVLVAVLGSAALFGVIHLNSLLVGRDPWFVAGQVVASALGGIGLGALRVRLGTLWPLIALHLINNVLQFSAAGGLEASEVAAWLPWAKIALSSALALYGAWLLRREIGAALGRRPRATPATS